MTVIGETGTKGKTSVVSHCASLLTSLGVPTATFGTLGVGFGDALTSTGLTTADPFTVQAELRRLRDEGAEAVAMEVSSHALDQGRVQAVAFDAAVMTNLSRDHLDYLAGVGHRVTLIRNEYRTFDKGWFADRNAKLRFRIIDCNA